MGLSGAKTKQRIPDDPRNVRWANDTSAPGFKLLSSMGWSPSLPSLGNQTSQSLISQNGGSQFSKKISSIPLAKEGTMGIGARKGAAIGVRAMGGSGGIGSMGFVSAGAGNGEGNGELPKTGGEFGRLLERLNKAKEEAKKAEAAEQPQEIEGDVEEDEKAKRKREKKEKKELKKRKREARDDDDDDKVEEEAVTEVKVVKETIVETPESVTTTTTSAILKNPRMAARSKHLRAKRLASSSNAAAMAEILGIAPTPSPSTSGTSTPLQNPFSSAIPSNGISGIPSNGIFGLGAGTRSEPLAINGPTESGEWPTAPKRSFPSFAASSTGGIGSTFVGGSGIGAGTSSGESSTVETFPSFAKASTTSIGATFEPATTTTTTTTTATENVVVEETEKEKKRREKREKKEEKKRRKEIKNDEGAEEHAVAEPVVPMAYLGFARSSRGGIGSTVASKIDSKEEDSRPAKKAKKEKKSGKTREEKDARRAAKAAKAAQKA